jgi:helicase required for RNAi-mediated heterochromatin assembly 1
MCFSAFRAGVKIDWNTSKRLKAGSIIALSPTSDKFQKNVTIAVVGARPMELLIESQCTECVTSDAVLTKKRPSED